MQYTDQGLRLTLYEINALLAFASDDPARTHLYGVHFEILAKGVHARATNGHIALDAIGPNDTERYAGEWLVHRDFLKGATKVLQNSDSLYLRFSGASLHDAAIWDDKGNERATFSWPNDAANSQLTFPDPEEWRKILSPPEGIRQVKCVTLNAEYLALMAKVAKAACTSGIDCYPPPKADAKAFFRIDGGLTTWLAVVMPMKTEAADDDDFVEPVDAERKAEIAAEAADRAAAERHAEALKLVPSERPSKARGKSKKTTKKAKGKR